MTLKTRRVLLNLMLIPALGAAVATGLAWWSYLQGGLLAAGPGKTVHATFSWWFVSRPAQNDDVFWALAALGFLVIFSLVCEALLRHGFGRNPSPELFFLRLLILSLPLQAVRLVLIPSSLGTIGLFWGLTANRVAWFARFLGIVAAANIGLYGSGIPFRGAGTVFGMGALGALAVGVMVPLDVTRLTGNLMFSSGVIVSLTLSVFALEFLAVISLAGSAFIQRNGRYAVLSVALLCILGGVDFLFFLSWPLVVPGALLLLAGVAVFVREIKKIYQWL